MATAPKIFRPNGKPASASTPRKKTAERGYGSKWQKASRAFLKQNPFCCGWNDKGDHARGCNLIATQTDHRIAIDGPEDPLFWDSTNWRARSIQCHSKKTATEDGAFGRHAYESHMLRHAYESHMLSHVYESHMLSHVYRGR